MSTEKSVEKEYTPSVVPRDWSKVKLGFKKKDGFTESPGTPLIDY